MSYTLLKLDSATDLGRDSFISAIAYALGSYIAFFYLMPSILGFSLFAGAVLFTASIFILLLALLKIGILAIHSISIAFSIGRHRVTLAFEQFVRAIYERDRMSSISNYLLARSILQRKYGMS